MLLCLLCMASEPCRIGLQSKEELRHRFVVHQPALAMLGDDVDALKPPLDQDGTTRLTAGPLYISPAAECRLALSTLLW
jgi:hypothetical protein